MNRFDWITSSGNCTKPDYDRPVVVNEHFVVLPTLGSLVPGWLLVVPRRKIPNLSFLTMSERVELHETTLRLEHKLSKIAPYVFLFEHGGLAGSLISCGVEQAHLHIVPLDFDLIAAVHEQDDVSWRETAKPFDFSRVPVSSEYFMVARNGQAPLIGEPREPSSQWFRRIIASKVGRPDEWNYKTHPAFDVMTQTLDCFGVSNG